MFTTLESSGDYDFAASLYGLEHLITLAATNTTEVSAGWQNNSTL